MRTLLFLHVLLAAACAESRANPSFATRDSAGVAIVESAVAAWGRESEWSVAGSPTLDLGVVEGQPEYEFVTILGLTQLSNGNIVVANRGTRELRFFSPGGEFIRAVGQDGEGPGEFRTFHGVHRYGRDSLVVWDYGLFRWSVFDTAGAFGRIIQPARALMNPRTLAPLDDGTLILADTWIDAVDRRSIDHQRLIRFSASGAEVDSLGSFRSREMFRSSDGPPVAMGRIFGATLVRVAAGDGFLIGPGEHYEVLDHDASGKLRRRIRWQGEDRTVTAADADAYHDRFRETRTGDDEIERAFLRLLEEVPTADRFPAYSELLVDADRNLWLAAYARPSRAGPRLWTVLDESGEWLGEVALPDGLEVWEIGSDYVLGVFDDELGVEHVRKYRLIKED